MKALQFVTETKKPPCGGPSVHLPAGAGSCKFTLSRCDGPYPSIKLPSFQDRIPTERLRLPAQGPYSVRGILGLLVPHGGHKVQHRQGWNVTDSQRLTEFDPRFTGDRGQSDDRLQWARIVRQQSERESLILLGDLLPSLGPHQ